MEEKVDGKTVTGDARVRRWTQKLLDLSLRNRLLNVRDGKQFIPLFCRDVCTLEDRLAESETVQLEQGDPEDAFLASTLTVEETRKRLTALYRQAKTDLEEGGVNTLFLAVGFLKWRPTPRDEKFLRAPVLLIPVRLVRKTLSDYRIARFDEETVNRFAAPEYMSKKQIRMYNMFGRYISRFFMGLIGKKLGCRERLDARPYAGSCRP